MNDDLPKLHEAVRSVLRHHKLTVHGDAVVEADLIAAVRAITAAQPVEPAAQVAKMDREATWWTLVMGAAASIEDAANCLRDQDAKRQAEGAAAHYRNAARKFSLTGAAQPVEKPAAGSEPGT